MVSHMTTQIDEPPSAAVQNLLHNIHIWIKTIADDYKTWTVFENIMFAAALLLLFFSIYDLIVTTKQLRKLRKARQEFLQEVDKSIAILGTPTPHQLVVLAEMDLFLQQNHYSTSTNSQQTLSSTNPSSSSCRRCPSRTRRPCLTRRPASRHTLTSCTSRCTQSRSSSCRIRSISIESFSPR
jgi:hypothetical protein